MKKKKNYTDFSNVEANRNQLVPEEFAEGPLGSPINEDKPVEGKSTPWQEGQRRQSAFVYPDKEQHAGAPRKAPGAHPPHDETDEF